MKRELSLWKAETPGKKEEFFCLEGENPADEPENTAAEPENASLEGNVGVKNRKMQLFNQKKFPANRKMSRGKQTFQVWKKKMFVPARKIPPEIKKTPLKKE